MLDLTSLHPSRSMDLGNPTNLSTLTRDQFKLVRQVYRFIATNRTNPAVTAIPLDHSLLIEAGARVRIRTTNPSYSPISSPISESYPRNWEISDNQFYEALDQAVSYCQIANRRGLFGNNLNLRITPDQHHTAPGGFQFQTPPATVLRSTTTTHPTILPTTMAEMESNDPSEGQSTTPSGNEEPGGDNQETVNPVAQTSSQGMSNETATQILQSLQTTLATMTTLMQHLARPIQEATPNVTTQPQTPAQRGDRQDWRLTDAGIFNPDGKDSQGAIHLDGKVLSWTDVHIWKTRIEEWVASDEKKAEAIREHGWNLFRGTALDWWDQQLSPEDKRALKVSYSAFLTGVMERFGTRPEEAQKWLDKHSYTVEMNKADESVRQYAMELFRNAKIWGDTTTFQLLTRLYNKLHPQLKIACPKPDRSTTIAAYLDLVEEKQKGFTSHFNSENTLGNVAFNAEDDDNYWSNNRDSSNSRPRETYQNPRQYPRQSKQPWNQPWRNQRQDERSDRYPNKAQQGTGWGPRRNQDAPATFSKGNDNYGKRRGDQRTFGHYRKWGQRQKRGNGTYNYVNETVIWDHEEDSEAKSNQLQADGYIAFSEGEAELSGEDENAYFSVAYDVPEVSNYFTYDKKIVTPLAPSKKVNQCTDCGITTNSAATLRKHLEFAKRETFPRENSIRSVDFSKKEDISEALLNFEEGQVIEANPKPSIGKNVKRRTSFFRIAIQSDISAPPVEVCMDTGSSDGLVSEEWLKTWATNPRFQERVPITVKGVAADVQITKTATFDFYITGKVNGKTVVGHFVVTANVVPHLPPKLLLGTNFMIDHGVKVDFVRSECSFRSVFNMKVQGHAQRKRDPAENMRKVTALQTVTIPAMTTAFVCTNYIDLPHPISKHDKSAKPYILEAKLNDGIDTTIDRFTPKRMLLRNDKAWPMKIHQGQRLGTIRTFDGDEVAQLADWSVIDTFWNDNLNKEAWAAIVEQSCNPEVSFNTQTEDPIPSKVATPSYGISRPENVQSIKTKEGVSVGATNTLFAANVVKLAESFDIWRDRGVAPMPDDLKLRVDLVEGWQDQLKTIRPYPLSAKDRKFLDEVHDALHIQGKMSFQDDPTAIACPVFVVWRKVNGKEKGRVVADLRPLNKIVSPDIYPLPDQDDIIADMAGKKYYSSVDASKFFFQLPVFHDHRNRMVVISPRGLERSNVALMGFKNSPAFAQRFMDRLFFDHRSFVRAYIDDIIIFSDSAEEHEEHLKIVFDILQKARIHIAPDKSFLAYQSVQLLGCVANGEGVVKTTDRIEAFRKLVFPNNLSALETYLGMADWLRKGIAWYSVLSAPLLSRKTELHKQLREKGALPTGMSKQTRKVHTSKVEFEPTQEEFKAFQALQENLCDQTMLWHHVPTQPLFIKLDACKQAVGVMVFQLEDEWDGTSIPGKDIPSSKIRPILFLSRVTSATEKKYGSTEAEVAALLWTCKKLRKLVHASRQPVQILTDHAATRSIVHHTSQRTMDLSKANPRLANAAIYLAQFDLTIHHIPGTLNVVPDALSRLPVALEYRQEVEASNMDELNDVWDDGAFLADTESTLSVISDEFRERIINGYATDHKYRKLYQILLQRQKEEADNNKERLEGQFYQENSAEWQRWEDRKRRRRLLRDGAFQLQDDLLYHVGTDQAKALCIPRSCVQDVLAIVHDANFHFGWNKMMEDMKGIHFHQKTWVTRNYVRFCETCITHRTDRGKTPGELQPIRYPQVPYETIAMDFITDMPLVPAKGTFWALPQYEMLNSLCTITCKASRKTLLIAGHTEYTAKDWATVILRMLHFADWGLPLRIISDRDRKFISGLWKEIYTILDAKLLFSTAYHPQTDGISERKNQTVETAIRYHYAANPDLPWVNILPALQHKLNNSYSAPIGRAPNELVLGFKPRSAIDIINKKAGITASAEAFEVLRADYATEAAELTDIAAELAKQRYDDKHTPLHLEVGDKVYLRLGKGYNLPGKPKLKWSAARAGEYTITKKIGNNAYKLDFPDGWKGHPVVSVAQLYVRPSGKDLFNRKRSKPGPVEYDQDGTPIYEVERIVSHRVRWNKIKPKLQLLVRWLGYTAKDDEWKNAQELATTSKDMVDKYLANTNFNWPKLYADAKRIYKIGIERELWL